MSESSLSLIKQYKTCYLIIFGILILSLVMCSQKNISEISTQQNVISCQYVGLNERNGQPIVDLIFKNNTGQNLKSIFGGLRIINQNGDVIQRTGFTYSLPFYAGEEKQIV